MTVYTIDRFEGELAVLLQRGNETVQKDIQKNQLPAGIQQGDIVDIEFNEDNKVIHVTKLEAETQSAKKRAEALLQKLIDRG